MYFPYIFMVQLTLKEKMESSDNFMRRMATQMYAKFTKYWSKFSLILAIAVVLDPCFKMQFVEFSYMKLYGSGNIETIHVREKLVSLFNKYVLNSLAPNKYAPGKDIGKVIENIEPLFGAKGSRDMLKVMLCFFKIKSINISCLTCIYSWPIHCFYFYDAGISLFSISRDFNYTKVRIEYVFA